MDKMVVIVFKDEHNAYEGIKALKELHTEGSLTLYAAAVVAKDAAGVLNVKHVADEGAFGTAIGLATGSLIGLLAGPVGAAAGAVFGTASGAMYDLTQVGIGMDFLDEVSLHLSPGKTAVVAEIEEKWVTPLDTRMDALGGDIFRRTRSDFVDAQIERELATEKAEIALLQTEHKQATGDMKTKLKAKIHSAQQRMQARREKLHDKIDVVKLEGEAKIKLMQEQERKARAEAKEKLDERMREMRAHHTARMEKLSEAWKLVKEAAAI